MVPKSPKLLSNTESGTQKAFVVILIRRVTGNPQYPHKKLILPIRYCSSISEHSGGESDVVKRVGHTCWVIGVTSYKVKLCY